MPANLDILATYSGEQALNKLEKQLIEINALQYNQNQVNYIAIQQNKIQTEILSRQNAVLQGHIHLTDADINNLAYQTNLNNELSYAVNNRLNNATQAYALISAYQEEGIILTEQEAAVAVQANNEIIASENAKTLAINNTRKALMAASISMFVLNISIGQMISSLKPLVKNNEDATKAIDNLKAAFALAMGPMQAFMSVQMIMTVTSMTLAQTLRMVGGALLFSIGLMGAITSKSVAMRAAFSALAGVAGVLAAAQFLSSVATFANAGAFATLQAVMGSPMGLIALAAGIGATAFAIGTVLSSKEKAQTLTGHRKRVRKGGLAELDDDEVVQRVSKDGTKGGGGDTIIVLPDSYNGSMADAKITAHMVRRLQNSGYGTVKYQRRAVGG